MSAKIISFPNGERSQVRNDMEKYDFCLYQMVMERLENYPVYKKDAYLFEKGILNEELNFFSKKLKGESLNSIYLHTLMKYRNLLEQIPIFVTKSQQFGEREIVTNIGIPNANIYSENYCIYQKIGANICLNGQERKEATNFFTIGEGELVTLKEMEEYVRFLTDGDHYLIWLNVLFSSLGVRIFDEKLGNDFNCLGSEFEIQEERERLLKELRGREFTRRLER